MNDDGSPDWDAISDEQKQTLGLTPKAEPDAPPVEVKPELVGILFSTVAAIEAAVVAPRVGISREQATRALTPPPPIAEQLNAAGARVLSKYSGALSQWSDEITLAMLMFTWQTAAFSAMREMKASEPAPKQDGGPAPTVEVKPGPMEVKSSDLAADDFSPFMQPEEVN